ncbi:MAG: hypothetical protein DRI61_14035 [Chloroflexi bacterium]|nr:MAG: hypothetical protein DRI61_14035 [Chloroflexota bacterium]
MEATRVGIAEAAKRLSELVNRAAYGGERFVLTSRGRPKAALIPLEDLGILEEKDLTRKLAALEKAKAVSERIKAEREARGIQDVDSVEILREIRQERIDEVTSVR